MHKYHGSSVHAQRQPLGECRCQSGGRTYRIDELIRDGAIRDPRNLQVLLTSDEIGTGPPRQFMFIYAVNEHYEFRIAPDGGPRRQAPADAVKHETLFQNADVRAAGEIMVRQGVIVEINDESGSYNTRTLMRNDPQFARDILTALDRGKIPATEVVLANLRDQGEVT